MTYTGSIVPVVDKIQNESANMTQTSVVTHFDCPLELMKFGHSISFILELNGSILFFASDGTFL